MATEFLSLRKRMEVQPELSLGPTWSPGWAPARSSSSESEGSSGKKRKKYYTWEDDPTVSNGSLDLQLNDPLPLDWEQCLDLQVSLLSFAHVVCNTSSLHTQVSSISSSRLPIWFFIFQSMTVAVRN
jgi:hypothetical protein